MVEFGILGETYHQAEVIQVVCLAVDILRMDPKFHQDPPS